MHSRHTDTPVDAQSVKKERKCVCDLRPRQYYTHTLSLSHSHFLVAFAALSLTGANHRLDNHARQRQNRWALNEKPNSQASPNIAAALAPTNCGPLSLSLILSTSFSFVSSWLIHLKYSSPSRLSLSIANQL